MTSEASARGMLVEDPLLSAMITIWVRSPVVLAAVLPLPWPSRALRRHLPFLQHLPLFHGLVLPRLACPLRAFLAAAIRHDRLGGSPPPPRLRSVGVLLQRDRLADVDQLCLLLRPVRAAPLRLVQQRRRVGARLNRTCSSRILACRNTEMPARQQLIALGLLSAKTGRSPPRAAL